MIEVTDDDYYRARSAILNFPGQSVGYHGTRNNCIDFVLFVLARVQDRALDLDFPSLGLPVDVLALLREQNSEVEVPADKVFADDGYTPCLAWK